MDYKERFLGFIKLWKGQDGEEGWRSKAFSFVRNTQGLYQAICKEAMDSAPFDSDSDYSEEELADFYEKVMTRLDFAKKMLECLVQDYELYITDKDDAIGGALTTNEGPEDSKMVLWLQATFVAD